MPTNRVSTLPGRDRPNPSHPIPSPTLAVLPTAERRKATFTSHRWIGKALAQKAIAKLGMLRFYHRGQQIMGRLKNFHPNSRIEYAGKLAADIGRGRLVGAKVVEIGAGWVPVVPIALHLLGAREIQSFDLTRHLRPRLATDAVALFHESLGELARRSGAPVEVLAARLRELVRVGSYDELTEAINFHYRAPEDFTTARFRPGSIDIVYSNLVLEHVTPAALAAILRHSRNVLTPGGLCWHNVDFTDHYAATHRGMSPVNFLRYSDAFWDAFGQNDILYQNRLRRSDYVAAFKAAGFVIERVIDHSAPEGSAANAVPLAPRFAGRAPTDITVSSSRFVLRAA